MSTIRWRAVALGAALTLNIPFALAASFDCARASNAAERAICASPALGELDVRMATYYEILQRARPADEGMAYREFRDALRGDQQSWRQRVRDACGGRIACLTNAYTARTAALRDVADERLALRAAGVPAAAASGPTAPLSADPAGVVYVIDGEPIKLTNGAAVQAAAPGSATQRVTKLVARSSTVTVAGRPVTAVLLSDDPGGSGQFLYVAAAQPDRGGTPAVLLGDRLTPVAVSIELGGAAAVVVVEYLDRPEGAPFAQKPSVRIVRRFGLESGRLVELRG
ncbi:MULTISPECIES: lysozyme inhibitor LprI family protein [Burkholderia]|uniref:lysozyme inhibitor LprI family protein n=1 Tax=Burkholderia TaxID=32008 RepID=UPI0008412988|nr:lysozyme inhibitor LprI family protein [Burkholderia sp. MSMB175]AOK32694.1 hypothetical protein AQ611_23730 [Burkholderia sp. Bp7605]